MPRFRKKPVVAEIEAEQWFPGNKANGVRGDDPSLWCGCTIVGGPKEPHVHTIHRGQIVLLEPGDWIVAEADGKHFYPVKPDVFAATYDAVARPPQETNQP